VGLLQDISTVSARGEEASQYRQQVSLSQVQTN